MPAPEGDWESAPTDSKVTAIHLCLLTDGRVLMFHCRTYPFWSRLYYPLTNLISESNEVIPKWPITYEDPPYLIQPSEIFCCGHCNLPDGRLLVAGGELVRPYPYSYEPIAPELGLRYSFYYNPMSETQPWMVPGPSETPHIMEKGRWYPTLTVLHDGSVLAMGGLSETISSDPTYPVLVNRTPEIYKPSTGWVANNSPSAEMPKDISYFYPDGQVIPVGSDKGKVFYSTTALVPDDRNPPTYTDGYPQIFDPFASGSEPFWTPQSQRVSPSEFSAGLLLPIRKGSNASSRILISGGQWGTVLDRVDYIDVTNPMSEPYWQTIEMEFPRYNHQAIILPDRSVLFIGGQDENGPVLISELLDTDSMTWINQDLPEMPIARMYHSTGILLPNGKILMAGGRVPDGGDIEDDTERRLSIFTPGYLMDGDPPVIADAPTEITYDEEFQITVEDANSLDSIALLKPGAVTHSNNMDQRYIELEFTQQLNGVYSVTAPSDEYKAPPGFYMLFVLKHASESNSGLSKIPSIAKFVKLVSPV